MSTAVEKTEISPALRASLFFFTGLTVLSVWLMIESKPSLYVGVICSLAFTVIAHAYVYGVRTKAGGGWGVIWSPRREHIIQSIAQAIVYLGWGAHWEVLRHHLPLLLGQVAFAYLIDMASVWRRGAVYKLGFGPVPIVLSVNLFLFFKAEFFYWQWPMIALAMLSKELFRRRQGDSSVHIFNPSAIALSVTALVLMGTEAMHTSWGEEIALSHATGPWSYELIFCAGLLVMGFFGVGLTIISAVLSTLMIGMMYHEITGAYRYLDTAIPTAVFLGMTLLVTDPATSPRSPLGKVVYGALYGLGVFVLYGLLRGLERPPIGDDPGVSVAFCDKLLAVPLLNMMVPLIDKYSLKLSCPIFSRPHERLGMWRSRLIFMSLWVALFITWVRPQLREHPGRSISVWLAACDETPEHQRASFACANRDRIYRRLCDAGDLSSCHNLALSWETGESGFTDVALAEELYERSCEGGKLMSCHHLGGLYVLKAEQIQVSKWAHQAERLLQKACDGEVWSACSRLAALHLSRWSTEDRRSEAWGLWERACDHGEPFACFEIGQRALQALPVHADRCAKGELLSCRSMERTRRLASGPKGLDPMTQARQALMSACQGSLWVACANVSWMMWRGDGGPRDPTRALMLMRRSCEAGLQSACERVRSMGATPRSGDE